MPVLVRAALISPGSTRALRRSVREPVSLPLTANVESAYSTRAEVIGSIDLLRPVDRRCPCDRDFILSSADFIRRSAFDTAGLTAVTPSQNAPRTA